MSFKQIIVVDEDLNLSKGKLAAQVAHASLSAYEKASSDKIKKWKLEGQKKVVVEAGDNSLKDLFRQAKRNKIAAHLVKDAGRTEVAAGTITALGLGPDDENKINTITGDLRLIK